MKRISMNKLFRFSLTILIIILMHSNLKGQTVQIMSYNLRYDNPNDGVNKWDERKESMLALINDYGPDIFGIQEGLHHQVEYLAENLSNYEYIGVGRDDGKQKGEYTALFFNRTKFSVLEESTFWLSDRSDIISVGWDASMERICTYGLFKHKISQKMIWVFNTHFDHIGVTAREKSAELIISKIKSLSQENAPTILMGDLNALPDSKPIAHLKTVLDDGLLISKTQLYGPSGTFNGFNPLLKVARRIDYIFTAKLNVLSYGHIDKKRADNNYISDHLPVLVKLNLPSSN
jgi:endonuclease/exonuclease/phosphatase family metal-dependent hydrolase